MLTIQVEVSAVMKNQQKYLSLTIIFRKISLIQPPLCIGNKTAPVRFSPGIVNYERFLMSNVMQVFFELVGYGKHVFVDWVLEGSITENINPIFATLRKSEKGTERLSRGIAFIISI